MNLKAQILQATDLPTKVVHVDEWDVTLTLKGLDCAQRDMWLNQMLSQQNADGKLRDVRYMRTKLVLMSAHDQDGSRIFDDGDIDALNEKSPVVIDRLADEVMRLSGLKQDPEVVAAMSGN